MYTSHHRDLQIHQPTGALRVGVPASRSSLDQTYKTSPVESTIRRIAWKIHLVDVDVGVAVSKENPTILFEFEDINKLDYRSRDIAFVHSLPIFKYLPTRRNNKLNWVR